MGQLMVFREDEGKLIKWLVDEVCDPDLSTMQPVADTF